MTIIWVLVAVNILGVIFYGNMDGRIVTHEPSEVSSSGYRYGQGSCNSSFQQQVANERVKYQLTQEQRNKIAQAQQTLAGVDIEDIPKAIPLNTQQQIQNKKNQVKAEWNTLKECFVDGVCEKEYHKY